MSDPLPSYKELTFDLREYAFDCPVGVWRARLRMKAWGKISNILLYFSEEGTGKKYCISVFHGTYHSAEDRGINFRFGGQVGELFELETAKNRSGRTKFLSAQVIAGTDNQPAADMDALTPVS